MEHWIPRHRLSSMLRTVTYSTVMTDQEPADTYYSSDATARTVAHSTYNRAVCGRTILYGLYGIVKIKRLQGYRLQMKYIGVYKTSKKVQ